MRIYRRIILGLCLVLYSNSSRAAGMTVDSDFEGASVEVLEIDPERQFLKIAPADHPGKGWRCWWYFRVDGLQKGKPFILDVGDAPWATPDRAHFSDNNGITWRHSEAGIREGKRIRYEIKASNQSMYFAWGPPFTPRDSKVLVDSIADQYSTAEKFNLATTRENRGTPALKITAAGDSSARRVAWLQARQHAWESGASWVAKGLAEFLVSDNPHAVQLRDRAVVYLVPIMDIDNTVRGAGGKNQHPQDHNRDWSGNPHWHAVIAAQKHILEADQNGKFSIFIDLHNPGANDRFPYFYIPPRSRLSPAGVQNLDRFLALAKQEITGPLRFAGRASESGPKYDPKNWTRISKNWVTTNTTGEVVAVTLETAWNTPSSTIPNYETVGKQCGIAVSKMLSGK